MSDWNGSRIYVAGHLGLVGRALVRALGRRLENGERFKVITRTRAETDLADASAVQTLFRESQPTHVILAAAKVGGIRANQLWPVDFLLQNLKIQNNVIEAAHNVGVRKLLFLGSSCVYPKFADQPIQESSLLTGALEPTNESYAIAKIAGIKLCDAYRQQLGDDFISAMPTNLYGPWDNFDPETSHALPAMIYKFHHAKVARAPEVTLWGTGRAKREWLHVDDAAEACLLLLSRTSEASLINIGTGEDCTIAELAQTVSDIVGYKGRIQWDSSKPDGTPRKLLDVSRISRFGWAPRISLQEGIRATYDWFQQNIKRGTTADHARGETVE